MSPNDQPAKTHSDQITDEPWKTGWEVDKQIPGGAQAEVFKIKNKSNKTPAFLKVLKKTTDTERRARFFRESAAYKSFKHTGLLPLIQTNAHNFEDVAITPYIITEWIDGQNLRSRIEQSGVLDLEEALAATSALLEIIIYLHGEGCIHRDIKPDNIILRGDQTSDPVLLDFGICYSDSPDTHKTEDGQELGNRFLRLPELSAGSNGKQDPISDLTFIAGILFFALTGHNPSTLRDSKGDHPHQVYDINPSDKIPAKQEMELMRFFDRAFQYETSRRFQAAVEMRSAIEDIAMASHDLNEDDDAILKDLSKQLSEGSAAHEMQLLLRCRRLIHRVEQVAEETIGPLNSKGVLVRTQADSSDFQIGSRGKFGFQKRVDSSRQYLPQIEAVNIGSEIVLTLDGKTIGRFTDEEPLLDDQHRAQIAKMYLNGVHQLLR